MTWTHKEATDENIDKYVNKIKPADDLATLVGDDKVYGLTIGGVTVATLEWLRDSLKARAVDLFTKLDNLHSQYPEDTDEPTDEALSQNADWIHELVTAWVYYNTVVASLGRIASGETVRKLDPRGKSFAEQLSELLGDESLSDEPFEPAPTIN